MGKIVFVCSELSAGGVETSLTNLFKYAFDESTEIELHLIDQKKAYEMELPSYVKVKCIDSDYIRIMNCSLLGDYKSFLKLGFRIGFLRIVISLFRAIGINKMHWLAKDIYKEPITQCDACFIIKENNPSLYYALSKIQCENRIAFFHTACFYDKTYKSIYESKKIKKIVTVSKGNKSFLGDKMPGIIKKSEVIHNIVPPAYIRQKKEVGARFEKKDGVIDIVSVCRVAPEKGIELIIDSAALLKKMGLLFKWYVIGPYDKNYTENDFEEALATRELCDCIEHIDFTSNPYAYMSEADFVVCPSKIESYGMTIKEAQILGTLVIATDTYGSRELIEEGISGSIVEHSADKIADKMMFYINNPDKKNGITEYLKRQNFDESGLIRSQIMKLLEE